MLNHHAFTRRTTKMTMRKRYGLILLACALGALLLAASVSAMRGLRAVTVPSKISIAYDAANGVFKGKVTSRNQRCVAGRRVELREVLSGPDRVVGRTRTDRRGSWRVRLRVGGRSLAQLQEPRRFIEEPRRFIASTKAARVPIRRPSDISFVACRLAVSRIVGVAPPPEDFGGQAVAERHPRLADHHLIAAGLFNRTIDRVEITTSTPFQRVEEQAVVFSEGGRGVRIVPVTVSSDRVLFIIFQPAMQTNEVVQVVVEDLPSGTRVKIEPSQAGNAGKELVVTVP
jgi:hypothetical protein